MYRNTVYISGPITKNPNYVLDFARAKAKLIDDIKDGEFDFTGIISRVEVNSAMPEDCVWKDYMEVCYRLLDLSQNIYMLRGWETSEGCRREHTYAKLLGLGVYYEELSD